MLAVFLPSFSFQKLLQYFCKTCTTVICVPMYILFLKCIWWSSNIDKYTEYSTQCIHIMLQTPSTCDKTSYLESMLKIHFISRHLLITWYTIKFRSCIHYKMLEYTCNTMLTSHVYMYVTVRLLYTRNNHSKHISMMFPNRDWSFPYPWQTLYD